MRLSSAHRSMYQTLRQNHNAAALRCLAAGQARRATFGQRNW